MGFSVLTELGGLALSAIGLVMQSDADADARRDAMTLATGKLALGRQTLASQIQASKEAARFQKSEARKKWKWMEEERGYTRAQEWQKNFNRVLDKTPTLRNNLMQVWDTGR